jgi:hypothetical protein
MPPPGLKIKSLVPLIPSINAYPTPALYSLYMYNSKKQWIAQIIFIFVVASLIPFLMACFKISEPEIVNRGVGLEILIA